MALLVIAVLFGMCGYVIGRRGGHELAGAALGALLGPLGLLVVLMLEPARVCAACGAPMHEDAVACERCGRSVAEARELVDAMQPRAVNQPIRMREMQK